jgi:hypothetical protein
LRRLNARPASAKAKRAIVAGSGTANRIAWARIACPPEVGWDPIPEEVLGRVATGDCSAGVGHVAKAECRVHRVVDEPKQISAWFIVEASSVPTAEAPSPMTAGALPTSGAFQTRIWVALPSSSASTIRSMSCANSAAVLLMIAPMHARLPVLGRSRSAHRAHCFRRRRGCIKHRAISGGRANTCRKIAFEGSESRNRLAARCGHPQMQSWVRQGVKAPH